MFFLCTYIITSQPYVPYKIGKNYGNTRNLRGTLIYVRVNTWPPIQILMVCNRENSMNSRSKSIFIFLIFQIPNKDKRKSKFERFVDLILEFFLLRVIIWMLVGKLQCSITQVSILLIQHSICSYKLFQPFHVTNILQNKIKITYLIA
jgi:hypothetical protein